MRTGWFIGISLVVASLAWAAGNMKPGQYEVSVQTTMEGMGQMPPHTMSKCVKPEDVKDPKDFIKKNRTKESCIEKDVKVDGNKVSWSVECHERGGTQTGHGEFTFNGDSYEGTVTVEINNPQFGTRHVTSHISGRRTGDCS